MIQASDLRIGNWVNNYKSGPVKITADGIKIAEIEEDFFSPIPLAPEILEKCGFEHNKKYDYYQFGKFILNEKFVMCDTDMKVQLKYLHQLQNLYFALTGEEIIVNFEP